MPDTRTESQKHVDCRTQATRQACLVFSLPLAILLFAFVTGCGVLTSSHTIRSSYSDAPLPKAKYHNDKGLKYFAKGSFGKAETHFRRAVDLDPRFAAPHNNLGNLFFSRRDLYQAAWEFQRASEMSPQQDEPLINLGLVHDEADRLEEASDYYLQALQIEPRNPIAMGNLARAKVKLEDDPNEIQTLLRELVFVDTRAEWVIWAQDLLATSYKLHPMMIEGGGLEPSYRGSHQETPLIRPSPTFSPEVIPAPNPVLMPTPNADGSPTYSQRPVIQSPQNENVSPFNPPIHIAPPGPATDFNVLPQGSPR